MVFASPLFLFLFLPLVVAVYFCASRRFKNLTLLAFSLAFYAWGEGIYVGVMLYSIWVSWYCGLRIENADRLPVRKKELWISVMCVLAPLLVFKYLSFVVNNASSLFNNEAGLIEPLHLPIGISFFTFQALSYLIDVYRSKAKAQSSVLHLGLYISLFPQLIAGPIVRYQEICQQLSQRVESLGLFASGVQRFVFGLAKKVLIANPLGYIADICFGTPVEDIGIAAAWIGVICYGLQIYFDFSGYSDMAIGLGRMFGFRFSENFNYPYAARSIREFWRRWHISLSTWFRDYVYLPLGGSRVGHVATMRNLLIVFLLCGFWHGASWNFMIWGLLHGVFLSLERTRFGQLFDAAPRFFQHTYVLLVVLVGWVFFRGDNLVHSLGYLNQMIDLTGSLTLNSRLSVAMDRQVLITLCAGILLSTPVWLQLQKRWLNNEQAATGTPNSFSGTLLLSILMLASLFEIVSGAYNPFIYFRF